MTVPDDLMDPLDGVLREWRTDDMGRHELCAIIPEGDLRGLLRAAYMTGEARGYAMATDEKGDSDAEQEHDARVV